MQLFTKKLFIATGFILLFLTTQAHALFEARLTYSLLASKPDLGALYTGPATQTIPSAVPNYGLGGDVLFFPPMLGLGFGARLENLDFSASSGGLEYKSTANRTALLLSYRLIDTLLHVGVNFSYGISHTGSISVKQSTPSIDLNWQPGSISSYQLGVDVGVSLVGLLVGGEVGYQNMKWGSMADKNNSTTNKPDTDMSGVYGKVYIGFGI